MSLHDSLFVEDAEEDVKNFLSSSEQRKRVLIFPPVTSYRRFLIHQLVQDNYGDLLQTFSIGQGLDRRTVVCYKSDFIGLPTQVNGVAVQGGNSFARKSFGTMGIESHCTPTTSPEHGTQRSRQIKSSPSVEIYVPPALRQTKMEKSPARPTSVEPKVTTETPAKVNRQKKRPDRAVYVPRHRRGAADTADNGNGVSTPEVLPKNSSTEQPRISKRPIERTPVVRKSPHKATSVPMPEKVESATVQVVGPVVEKIEEWIPETELNEIESELTAVLSESPIEEIEDLFGDNGASRDKPPGEEMVVETEQNEAQPKTLDEKMIVETERGEAQPETLDAVESEDSMEKIKIALSNPPNFETCSRVLRRASKSDAQVDALSCTRTESNVAGVSSEKVNAETKSFSDCANGNTVKKSLVSKVLVISTNDADETESEDSEDKAEEDKFAAAPATPPEKKVKKIERPKSKPAQPPAPTVKINRDECDWDSLFDDNGDCLDPTLIEELTSSVGEVVIEKPKSKSFAQNRPVEISNDEFGHVLEIYNFPSEFKSSDLAAVFSPFKTEGFELKWVDDTHCLAVFSSPLVAAEVLASDHPFVKTRPLSEATALSKAKARKSSESLQPFKTRPVTCAALARRLVTKSLGVKLATARQEREQEKIVLREAKEKKRLANKQREEIWEGIIAPKPTS